MTSKSWCGLASSVVVNVSSPAVRYAWSNYPESPNLFNGARLPARPFRTDAK